jgi:hypothetical protein
MNHQRYVVKKGDCLWDLAETYLGSPWQWPRIYSYNNRSSIVRLTGRGIENPDLIYVDQVIYLPVPAGQPPTRPPVQHRKERPKSLKDEVSKIKIPFVMAYQLEDLPLMVYEDALFSATIKLSGQVAVRLTTPVPLAQVSNRGLDMFYAMQTEELLGRLFEETQVSWDRNDNTITYQSLIVSNSITPQAPSTALGIEVASDKPVPVLRAEIRYPSLSGYIKGNFYTAMDVRVVIELEPKVPPVAKGPDEFARYPVRPMSTPASQTKSSNNTDAWWLIGTGAAILAGTLITDLLVFGVLDDFVTIPPALSMIGRGVLRFIFPVVSTAAPAFAARAAANAKAGIKLKSCHIPVSTKECTSIKSCHAH